MAIKDIYSGTKSCVRDSYVDFEWEEERWKYHHEAVSFWKEQKNRRKFFEYVYSKLNLTDWKDWYNVQASQVSNDCKSFKRCCNLAGKE